MLFNSHVLKVILMSVIKIVRPLKMASTSNATQARCPQRPEGLWVSE